MAKSSRLYLSLVFAFLLGIHRGNLALWEENTRNPIAVFPIRAELLPPADQRALKQGIRVESRQELHRLLEDYLS